MIDPTTSLNAAGPCGLMLAADASSSAASPEGTGFASALAQAGAAAQDSAAEATEAAPAIATIAPVEAEPAADALQALPGPVDLSTTLEADVQALEASFESLAGLAHQLNGSHGDIPATPSGRNTRPSTLTSVDSAIAALVEALQFAPRPDAAEALNADAAPGISIDDGGVIFGGDEVDDSDEAQLTDPLICTLPAPVPTPTPMPAGTLPNGSPPLAAAPLPGENDPALAPLNERKSPGVEARPGVRSTLSAGRDRQAPGLQGMPGDDVTAAPPRSAAPAAEAVTQADSASRIAEPRAAQAPARSPTETPFQALLGATPTTAGTAPQAAASAPTTFQAQLSAAIDSPNFGAALGVQISTLADNGISEARLHLNPAELGPIAVQIGLDGTLAQVHMAVEHSSTRQALEQAMPELAAALRDAGFTMTGGGVSQQTREQQQQAAATAATGQRAGAADEALAALATPVRATRRGMLDVYA